MKKKLGSLVVAVLLIASMAVAQPNESMPKSFKTFGWSGLFLFDYHNTVVEVPSFLDQTNYYSGWMPSAYTVSWGWRWNLTEFNDHLSLSIETQPMLGFSFGTVGTPDSEFTGFMNFDLPIMVGINSGTAATFRSIDFNGFAYNIGVNIMQSPISGSVVGEGNFLGPQVMLCTSLKFRSWTYKKAPEGRGSELELFASFGNQYLSEVETINDPGFFTNRPVHFAMIFRKMLNY